MTLPSPHVLPQAAHDFLEIIALPNASPSNARLGKSVCPKCNSAALFIASRTLRRATMSCYVCMTTARIEVGVRVSFTTSP